MLEEKQTYEIHELFDALEITLAEMARDSQISEVTLARVRDGKPARRPTANKLLSYFSRYYGCSLTTRNVKVNIQDKRGMKMRPRTPKPSSEDEDKGPFAYAMADRKSVV